MLGRSEGVGDRILAKSCDRDPQDSTSSIATISIRIAVMVQNSKSHILVALNSGAARTDATGSGAALARGQVEAVRYDIPPLAPSLYL